MTHDAAGRTIAVMDARGYTSTAVFNNGGQITATENALGYLAQNAAQNQPERASVRFSVNPMNRELAILGR